MPIFGITPDILPGPDAETADSLELADIVRLAVPYRPHPREDGQQGPFPLGIVAEILTIFPDGKPRNVSLYLYDPQRRQLFLGPNGIPAFVDFHVSELTLYKRAKEPGYVASLSFP